MVGILEAECGVAGDGCLVRVYDVSGVLPGKGWARRPLEQIRRLYLHHSGRLGASGYEGLLKSTRYMIRARGWNGCSYHFWIPYQELLDLDGGRVVFRAQPDEARTFHAGKAPNERGVAICLQGNLTAHDMSEHQVMSLPVLLSWLGKGLGITSVPIGHFQATDGHAKEACPGRAGKGWVLGYQAGKGCVNT